MENKNGKAVLDHLNLTVRSFEETAAWYGRVFGFDIVEQGTYDERPWGILRSGDSMLCVYENSERASPGDGSESDGVHQIDHFGLRIQDRQRWERTLEEYSIKTYYGSPVRYPRSTSWYITDPTGYSIEVALWDDDQVRF